MISLRFKIIMVKMVMHLLALEAGKRGITTMRGEECPHPIKDALCEAEKFVTDAEVLLGQGEAG